MSGTDDPPMTVEHLKQIAYDTYVSFYNDPRRISYFELSHQVGMQNVRVLDYVATAVDQGCQDAKKGHEILRKDQLFDRIGEPSDERWDLVAGERE